MSAKVHAPAKPAPATAHTKAHGTHSARKFFHTQPEPTHTPRFNKNTTRHDSSPPSLQQQVVTGNPGDRFEREADTMAKRATASASFSMASAPLASQITPLSSRATQAQDAEESQAQDAEVMQARVEHAHREDETVQSQDENESAQAKAEEEPAQAQVDDAPAQTQLEEEPAQAKNEDEPAQAAAAEEPAQAADEEPAQAQAEEEIQPLSDAAPVQSFAEAPASPENGAAVQRQIRERRGKGAPLSDGVRSPLEERFSVDFSDVRIHTDDPAVQLTRALHAHAFTQGADIFFNAGRFAPESSLGQRLLAHELTHTIQQGAIVADRSSSATAGATATHTAAANTGASPADAPTGDAVPAVETLKPSEPTQPEPASAEEEAAVETEAPLAEDADVGVAPVEFPPNEAEPVLEMPPQPPPVPAAAAPLPEPLPMAGPSEAAMSEFASASPSQMAATAPVLATSLDDKLSNEQTSAVENAPVFVAETSGVVEEGTTPADALGAPAEVVIGDGVTGAEPAPLEVAPHENLADTPSNEASKQQLAQQEEGGLLAWLRDNFASFMKAVKTSDDGLNTSAGARPNVELAGEADPARMSGQRDEAQAALVAQRDAATADFKNNPGQANIQPKEVHQEFVSAPAAEAPAPTDLDPALGAADYAAVEIPLEVRARADEMLAPQVNAGMAKANSQSEAAARQRDEEQRAGEESARQQVTDLNAEAEKEQRDAVITNRMAVAKSQGEGIESAYSAVNDFNAEADSEQVAANKQVSDKVAETESASNDTLETAEADAEGKKAEGEKEAEAKKAEIEDDQESESWWDQTVDAIKSAVSALTSAIDYIFTKYREAVAFVIETAKNAVVGMINAARDFIVGALNAYRDFLKSAVDLLLKDTFPGLAAAINSQIDATVDLALKVVNAVADGLIAGVTAIADAYAALLDKILSVYQTALKAAVQIAGAVLTGDFAEALRIAVQAACDIAGIPSQPIFDFIDRAGQMVNTILQDPAAFFGNLIRAVVGGIGLFVSNIGKHLISGLVGWLTGALSEVAITIPSTLDLASIFDLAMQILGLTYDNIKARIIKKYPPAETVFDVIEKSYDLIRRLVTEGPMALWDEVKSSLSNLGDVVMGAIRNWLIGVVVKEGIAWLLGLLNPALGIVKLLKATIDFIIFLVERFNQIVDFVASVYLSIEAIASGALGAAMAKVEEAMARSLPVLISLLASLAGLGGLGKTVKNIISKVSTPVNKAIDFIIDKVIAFAKKLFGKAKAGAKKVKDTVTGWIWSEKKGVPTTSGESHTLSIEGNGTTAELYIASAKGKYLNWIEKQVPVKGLSAAGITARNEAKKIAAQIDRLINADKATGMQKPAIVTLLNSLAVQTRILADEIDNTGKKPPPSVVTYGAVNADGGGTSVNASVLSRSHPKGTIPQDSPPLLTMVARRKISGMADFQKGHLLSQFLGGPGRAYNLAPMTRSVNRNFESLAEGPVYALVEQQNKVVRFRCDVSYSRHDTRKIQYDFMDIEVHSVPFPDDLDKIEILKYEQDHMPKRISWEYHQLEYDNATKRWKDDPAGAKGSDGLTNVLPDGDFSYKM